MNSAIGLLALVLMSGVFRPQVIVKGTVRYCGMGAPGELWRDAKVSAFDVRTNRKLVGLVKRMEEVRSRQDWDLYFARYDTVDKMVKTGRVLSRSITDSKGRFTLAFAATDSVLVYAYDELEDETTFFTYKLVGGRANSAIALHIHGECGPKERLRSYPQ